MAVISITISESEQQIIAGIPKSVSVETNIPSTVFYTVDGTTPTTASSVLIGPLTLPTNNPSVTLKLYATNGVDSSAVITTSYGPDLASARQPHDTVIGLSPTARPKDNFPFGDNGPIVPIQYGPSGGITVDSPDLPNEPAGYDGTGTNTVAGGTDLPYTLESYEIKYSDMNTIGEFGRGVGTLPAHTTIRVPTPTSPSSSSKAGDKLFNPRAMVIYQDSRDAPYDPNISQLNRGFFSFQDIEKSKSGGVLLNTAFDNGNVTGSFVRAYFNPRDNTITYYYRDSDTNRWIISKELFVPRNDNITSLHQIVFSSRDQGAGLVFKWIPFMYRKLI